MRCLAVSNGSYATLGRCSTGSPTCVCHLRHKQHITLSKSCCPYFLSQCHILSLAHTQNTQPMLASLWSSSIVCTLQHTEMSRHYLLHACVHVTLYVHNIHLPSCCANLGNTWHWTHAPHSYTAIPLRTWKMILNNFKELGQMACFWWSHSACSPPCLFLHESPVFFPAQSTTTCYSHSYNINFLSCSFAMNCVFLAFV